MNNKLLKFTTVFCVYFVILFAVDCFIPRNESKIYNSVVRLHILANSDSQEDQNLKLQIRDAIIDQSGQLFEQQNITELPLEQMEQIGEQMVKTAQQVIDQNGYEYQAGYIWGREKYPTREYDGITFPSGEYYSLRITVGEGKGSNWWCVMFPPLCTNASTAKEQLGEAGIDYNSSKVYTEKKYAFRFKIMELF